MNVKVDGPDGLEAWCVAFSACFINFVMAGLGRMSGILYVAFIDIFQVDRFQASVPFSVRSLTRNLLGPVVGILGQKYGVRATTLLGAVIGTLSVMCCFYANNMLWITVMWGAFNGAGTALTITLPQVVLGKHFKKYRTTASGIAFSGGCVGSFFLPALLEYLLHTYGLGGTFLILAGVIMNVIPAAILLKEPSWLKKVPKENVNVSTLHEEVGDKLHKTAENTQKSKTRDEKFSYENNVFKELDDDVHKNNQSHEEFLSSSHNLLNRLNVDTQFLREKNKLVMQLFAEYFINEDNSTDKINSLPADRLSNELEHLYTITDEIMIGESSSRKTAKESNIISDSENNCKKMQQSTSKSGIAILSGDLPAGTATNSGEFIALYLRKLITEEKNNILTFFHENEHAVILKLLHQLHQMYQLVEDKRKCDPSPVLLKGTNSDKNTEKSTESSNTFLTHVKTAFRLHTNPMFLLISFCRSVHFLTFVPAVTIIVDFAMDKGLLEEDGKFVIAALSLGDLMGRVCLGWITDKEYLGLPRYMLLIMVMQGACTASLSFMYSKASLLFLIAIFGLLQGSLFVRHPVLVSKYLGKNEQSVAMGCSNFISGLLGFALPNYIGYFRDTIGSYNYIFYINGAIGSAVGIMWVFEPYLAKYSKSNDAGDEPV